jgi:hypothetical protein
LICWVESFSSTSAIPVGSGRRGAPLAGNGASSVPSAMRINTEALPNDIDSAVDWISGLIGAAIDKRVAGFEQQERSNPLLASYFRNNYSLEFA